MNSSIIFLVFVAIVEIIFYIQGEVRSMATFGIVAALFALIFFLSNYKQGGKLLLASVLEYWKPPHQRVKKIMVGNSKAPNIRIIRIKEQVKKVSDNADGGNDNRYPNSSQVDTSCTIPIITNNDRIH